MKKLYLYIKRFKQVRTPTFVEMCDNPNLTSEISRQLKLCKPNGVKKMMKGLAHKNRYETTVEQVGLTDKLTRKIELESAIIIDVLGRTALKENEPIDIEEYLIRYDHDIKEFQRIFIND